MRRLTSYDLCYSAYNREVVMSAIGVDEARLFDCLHDIGDPVGVTAHARQHLEPDGTVLLVEPFALDGRAANQANNPMAALLYLASTAICTPSSLSQEVGLGLGAQAGEARLCAVFEGPASSVPQSHRDAAQSDARGPAPDRLSTSRRRGYRPWR